jgi:hypothetical protein
MDTPTHYADVSDKALKTKEKYKLSDTQTLLYDHICRGDFKLRNEDGQLFYDKNSNGFGYGGSREWVKKQFQPLIKDGLVNFTSLRDCRDGKYTSWYFYCPGFELDELIDASCYVSTYKLFNIKHYLNLEDGFNKKNQKYGDIEFIYDKNKKYTFKYKGESSIYAWDNNGEGKIHDLSWMNQTIWSYDINGEVDFSITPTHVKQSTWTEPRYYNSFSDMIHDIWSFLAHYGCKYINIPNTSERRRFTI